MAYTTIDSPKKYFEAKTYTGSGSTQSITGLEFSPDLVWIKNRSGANSHGLVTSLVDTRYALDTSATSAEVDFSTSGVTSLNSDGFTVVSHPVFNSNANNYISWNWRGSDSSAVSNTSGSITSTVSANPTAGFSIVTYTGAGGASTVGHGLGVIPRMIILKGRSNARIWVIGHGSLGWTKYMSFDAAAVETNNYWNDTTPTANVFSVFNSANVNGSGETYVAYCFAEIKGYSKFGSYTGNGSADGTFIYTGFKPAFVMVKSTGAGANWLMQNNKTLGYNASNSELYANLTNAEGTFDRADLLSNGFKPRINSGENNSSGVTYIYMAFAENPFVSSTGIPTTAR